VARLVFVNRFFYPDASATSQMLTDLARYLAATGQQVVVVTSRLSYGDAKLEYPPRESVFGIEVIRVYTTRFGRARLLGRAVDYLSFYVCCGWQLARTLSKGDVVIAKTDPPMLSILVGAIARIKRAVLVNWLQDIFPEVATRLGMRLLQGRPASWLRLLRDHGLRGAAANIVLGERMRDYLLSREIPAQRIEIISNWADDRAILPIEAGDNPLREEWGLAGKFAVGYSGNLGRAHDSETFLQAARLLQGRSDIRFFFIGGGAQFDLLRQRVKAEALGNVLFKPYQPREKLGMSLGAMDLHLVSLNPALEGCIVPSKTYGILAAGRPIAFVGDREGEIGGMLARFDCGAAFSAADAQGLADFILRLAQDLAAARAMGLRARATLESRFAQRQSLEAWARVLNRVSAK